MNVHYEGQQQVLPLVIVKGTGPSLFGRNWLKSIRLNWNAIHQVSREGSEIVIPVLEKHKQVFAEGLGTLVNFEAKIYVDPHTQPN